MTGIRGARPEGTTDGKRIWETLAPEDHGRPDRAVLQCREILERLGVGEKDRFPGTLNARHPGGMMLQTEAEKKTLPPSALPDNLYLADASLLPKAMGNPPMRTIMALAQKSRRSFEPKGE